MWLPPCGACSDMISSAIRMNESALRQRNGYFKSHTALSAPTMSRRAARNAGRNPPSSPIASANANELTAIAGDSENANASSENDVKLSVEIVTIWSSDASATPTIAPAFARALGREQKRLAEKSNEDAPALKAQRPQRADLGRAVRHRAVHRDHRADGRADAEDDGDEKPQDADERRHHLGLLLEKFLFDFRVVAEQAVVGLPRGDERRERLGVAQLERQRRVGRPFECVHDLIRVAPDLRIRSWTHSNGRPTRR